MRTYLHLTNEYRIAILTYKYAIIYIINTQKRTNIKIIREGSAMKKIVLLLLSISTVVYTMEKDIELQNFENFDNPLEISTERAKQFRTDLASVSTSKSDEVIEKIEEFEKRHSKTPPTKRRATTLTKEEIDETKQKEREPAHYILDIDAVKKKQEEECKFTKEELIEGLFEHLFSVKHAANKKDHVKPVAERVDKILKASATVTPNSREERIQKALGIIQEASTERSTHTERAEKTKVIKTEDRRPKKTSITEFMKPDANLDDLIEEVNDYFHEKDKQKDHNQTIWGYVYKGLAIAGFALGGGIGAGVTAAITKK
jgi:hypothetical protein